MIYRRRRKYLTEHALHVQRLDTVHNLQAPMYSEKPTESVVGERVRGKGR